MKKIIVLTKEILNKIYLSKKFLSCVVIKKLKEMTTIFILKKMIEKKMQNY